MERPLTEAQSWLAQAAAELGVSEATVERLYPRYAVEVLGNLREDETPGLTFQAWAAKLIAPPTAPPPPNTQRIAVEGNTREGFRVAGNTAQSRTIKQLLDLLCAQPVGSASETLIEAALRVAAVQRENATLRIENEDLKLRLRAAGVQLP